MKKYKSKIGLGIITFLSIILGFTSTIMIINQIWPGLVIILAVAAFIAYVYNTTYYMVNHNKLIIKCGFINNTVIDINKISKIEETNNHLSSPALSTDRLIIFYSNKNIMISPKDKIGFIIQLKIINPNISIKVKQQT